MEKFLLIFAILFFQYKTLKSQPIIQSQNLANPGYGGTIYFGEATSPGSAGANQTWDFRATEMIEGGSFSIINPATTPASESFPNSNYAIQEYFSVFETLTYQYFNLTNTVLEQTGAAIGNIADDIYSNPKTYLQFPLTYNQTITDTWTEENSTASLNITYDAYGTLITDLATYENVVRLKYTSGGIISYTWFTTNPVWRILEYEEFGNIDDITLYSPSLTTGIDATASQQKLIYSNPFIDNIIISSGKVIYKAWAISVSGTVEALSVSEKEISASQLQPGFYLLKVEMENGEILFSRFVKE